MQQTDYALFFDENPVPMWILDLKSLLPLVRQLDEKEGSHAEILSGFRLSDGLMVRANRTMVELMEGESEEELRSGIGTILDGPGLSALVRGSALLLKRNRTHVEEIEVCSLKERPLNISLTMTASGRDAELRRVLVTVRNNTSHRELEEQLSVLSLLPETNPNMVILMKCQGQISYLNPAARRWIRRQGGDEGEIDTRLLRKILPDDFYETQCGSCDRQQPRSYATGLGDEIFRVQITPIVGADQCMIVISDVSELDRLRREREIYFHAFEGSVNPVLITDSEGRIEYINRAFSDFYGYSADEARGRTPNILNPGREEYYNQGFSNEKYDQLFSGLWDDLKLQGKFEGVVINQCRNKGTYWVKLIINSISVPDSNEIKYLAFAVDIDEMRRQEMAIRLEMLETINRVGEMRDNETGNHMIRVGSYARCIAEHLGESRKFCGDLQQFAPLHDIGKVGITDRILLAPRRLEPDEFSVIQQHTVIGHNLLAGKDILAMADEIAYCHHEKYDGSGYPQGLSGEEIPLSARITALADVYDALRSQRPYKEAWTHAATVSEMIRGAGGHFDPRLIGALKAVEGEFERIYADYGDEKL